MYLTESKMVDEMNKTLFEMLAIADQERIHTQIIAWLLTPEYFALSKINQAKLIESLFGLSIHQDEISKVKIITELNNLDFVLIHGNDFIVVENKLKSKQGKDQLSRYNEVIDNFRTKYKKKYNLHNEPRKFFLTFSGEISNDTKWNCIDYQAVRDAISSLDNTNSYIKDYLSLLNRLISARDEFLKDHRRYKEVFKRSGMKAEDRFDKPLHPRDDTEKFICENKLERMFIETLYRGVLIKQGFSNAGVDESHGVSLIQIYFFKFLTPDNKTQLKVGLQIQGSSLKYVLSSTFYHQSTKDDLPNELIEHIELALDKTQFRSNAARSKAYHSWSRKIADTQKIENLEGSIFGDWLKTQAQEAENFWRVHLLNMKENGLIKGFESFCSHYLTQPDTACGLPVCIKLQCIFFKKHDYR